MTKRLFTVVFMTAILTALTRPALAAAEPSNTLEGLVKQAAVQIAPFAAQRGLAVVVEAPGVTPVNAHERATMRERFVNLLANAVALSPGGNRVRVSVDADGVSVWVDDRAQAWTVDRRVQDAAGNRFRVRSIAGQGVEISARLDVVGFEMP